MYLIKKYDNVVSGSVPTEEDFIGGPKSVVWQTLKMYLGQLVFVILLEPFHC